MDELDKRVSRRGVFLGTLVGIPAAALVALLASRPVSADGGRDPVDDDDDDDD